MTKDKDLLPKGKVKVNMISPIYPYFGFIVDRDSDFIYLDTGKFAGIMALQIKNIHSIIESDSQ